MEGGRAAEAASRDVPILLSVGYAHATGVM
jgi:uncharacterized protein YyaL (SSP411 family)